MSKEIEEKLASLDLTSTTESGKQNEKQQSQNNRKSLDDLIEEYLIELDRYSSAQKAAGIEFSKVFGGKKENTTVTMLHLN
jgi:hypothetical protein